MKWLLVLCAAWLPPVAAFAQEAHADTDLLAWIHDGYEGPLAPQASSNSALAWQLAQLVPPTHGITAQVPPTTAIRQTAVHEVLNFWAQDAIPLTWQDATYARLRGHIDHTAADQIIALLQQDTVPRRTDLLNLLLEAPFDDVRHVLIAFVLDDTNPAPDRGRVVETLLLMGGRESLQIILPAITADAEAPFMRRLFSAWRTCITQDDLPLLQQLATEAEGFVAQFALQLWAIHERDPVRRMQIYNIARGTDSSYRTATMSALVRGGKDESIAAALIAELNSSGRNARRMARRLIPQFASEQALLDVYLERAASMSLSQRSQWMPDLARLSLPAASHIAMEWLVEGGWSSGNTARSVVRFLERSAEVDSLLPTLLNNEELPKHIRFPLAVARGPHSDDARAYLRYALPELMPSEQSQVFHILVATGNLADLLLVRDFVFDPAKPISSRVEGMRALAAIPRARELIGQWRNPLPQDYQIMATLIELLLLSDQPEWRQWALATAMSPPDFFDHDEARGLRTITWRVLGQRRAEGDVELLAATIATQLLAQESRTPSGEAWAMLFRFESEFPELAMLLASYLRCSRPLGTHTLALPADFNSTEVAADVLVIAASYLAEVAPVTAAEWFADLAARSLQPQDLLRVAGLSASRLPYGPASDTALDQLLADPETLRESPRIVAQSFAPVGIGWVLIHDRLAEQRLLSQVLQQQRPLLDLEILLEGWVEDDVLETAAEFAADAGIPEGQRLALKLQQRRTTHLPLSGQIHAVVATLAEQLGELELAEKERGIVRRLLPQDSTSSR